MRTSLCRVTFVVCLLALTGAACTTHSTNTSATTTTAQAGTPAATVTINSEAAALVPADVKARGTLTIASTSTNAPMEFLDEDGKTLVGFDIDFSDAIAATLGLKAAHINSTFDAIIPGLAAHKYDVGMSGFFITPARERVVDFVPYLRDGSALVVPSGNPLNLAMDPATLCGHQVAGEKGSVQGIEYLPAISKDCQAAGKKPVTILLFPKLDEAHLALTGGRADAIMEDSIPSGYRASRSNGKYEVAPGGIYKPVQTGIAFPKGSALAPAVRSAVASLAADGTMQRLMDKWSLPSAALLPQYN
ncbi:polar amino acid transport system substrate-binding protein [Nonomuraea thailandensis]|uniref:Polar amino acid transport system substrate-binding protein n=1 Tax=Nonomuraea thailandensis TaxID=1188745 RepID=A0A9X2K1F6_9ACTN|nr:ABC transporter substrate-binding protein [Nonomuraea thailandensis]MCP2353486.1 polar amino acid transport system substrate-binding protein [Nonomuraea thailandensis]